MAELELHVTTRTKPNAKKSGYGPNIDAFIG